jgi:hypothetical protein
VSRRARKRARAATAGSTMSPPPSRSELKNAEARAKLVPLREGERPGAVTAAAIVSLALVVANLALALAGFKIDGKRPALAGVIVFTALLLAMAVGLWRARYWAVLGFQALLAITMLVFALRLPFAANVTTVLISLAVLVPATTLFWFLIKAMARIQMPARRVE